MENKSVFAVLNSINCNEHTEEKNKLTYLSWAWAWQICKQNFPDATYTVYEWVNQMGCPQNYFTDGRTCWVKTGVTINGQEHIEDLPVMDYHNRSVLLENVTSMDVNKAIQRSLTKALARHGLGLYIYAGEDIPDAADDEARAAVNQAQQQRPAAADPTSYGIPVQKPYQPMTDDRYWQYVAAEAQGMRTRSGRTMKEAWKTATNAGPREIAQFDYDLDRYLNGNI